MCLPEVREPQAEKCELFLHESDTAVNLTFKARTRKGGKEKRGLSPPLFNRTPGSASLPRRRACRQVGYPFGFSEMSSLRTTARVHVHAFIHTHAHRHTQICVRT